MLNLDNDVPDKERVSELKKILDNLVSKIQIVNTEDELLNELKKRPDLNDIPLIVKKHFHIM